MPYLYLSLPSKSPDYCWQNVRNHEETTHPIGQQETRQDRVDADLLTLSLGETLHEVQPFCIVRNIHVLCSLNGSLPAALVTA